MLESEVARQKEEVAALKQQLAEAQTVEKERKRLADKLDKLENKVRYTSSMSSPFANRLRSRWTRLSKTTFRRRRPSFTRLTMSDCATTMRGEFRRWYAFVIATDSLSSVGRRTCSDRSRSLALSFESCARPPTRARPSCLTTVNDKVGPKLPLLHFNRLIPFVRFADQETIARLAEADQITEDLERANSRVHEVERRNEKLRAEIEAVRSGSESAGR